VAVFVPVVETVEGDIEVEELRGSGVEEVDVRRVDVAVRDAEKEVEVEVTDVDKGAGVISACGEVT